MNSIEINEYGRILENGKIILDDPLQYLNCQTYLTKDFTLRSYFNMIEIYPVFKKLNKFFNILIDQYKKGEHANENFSNIDYLELGKTIEMIGFPNDPRMEIYYSLYGVYSRERIDIKYYQIKQLLDVSLRLGMLKHIVFGDKMDTLEFETVYSLFDVIDGVAWELSFLGTSANCEIRR